jgi:predicted MPP superfamily phosphohydrolase
MFGTILISLCTVMQIYVFWRIASVPLVTAHLPRSLLAATALVLWGFFFLGRVYGHHGTGPLAVTLEFLGMNWMGALLLLFLSFLATDLVTGFGLFLPRAAPSLRGWALVAGAILVAIALFQGMRPPVVKRYEVRLSGLPDNMDGTVLVAMSDLHVGSLLGNRWLAARVAQVREQQPDIVVMLGDIYEGHGPPSAEVEATMRGLDAPLGVWSVTGNHEFHGMRDGNKGLPEASGLQWLRNRWAEVRPGFVLAGVDDLTSLRRAGLSDDLITKALTGRPPGATVLLSHTPWQAEKAAAAGAGLMLSGHTHGGQIWPFGYLTRQAYPLLAGRYEVDGMPVIVCRGTGTWGPRMRLWHPAEILRVTLRKH